MSTSMLLVTIWATLLILFMVLRPSPYSATFWVLLGSSGLAGGLYMLLSHRESRRMRDATAAWLGRVSELVDIHDYADDGHLPDYLDDAERRRVLEELQRMPAGRRSLRRALALVSPELVDNDD